MNSSLEVMKSLTRSLIAMLAAAAIAGCATTKPAPEPEAAPAEEVKAEEPAVAPLVLETVYFEYNQYGLKTDVRDALKRNVEKLLARPEVNVTVDGHCDERGTDAYNIDLGWKRAYAVRDYLKAQGIDDSRMFPASYGRARPAVTGDDEQAWSKNRRVETGEKK